MNNLIYSIVYISYTQKNMQDMHKTVYNTKLNTRSTTFGSYVLFLSILLGYLSDLIFFFSPEIWTVWFVVHMSSAALICLLGEKGILYMEDQDRIVYIIIVFLSTMWYINRINLSTAPDIDGYLENCNKNVLLITSVTTTFVSMFSLFSVFLSLFFF